MKMLQEIARAMKNGMYKKMKDGEKSTKSIKSHIKRMRDRGFVQGYKKKTQNKKT